MPGSLLAPVLVDTLAPPSGPWKRVDVLTVVDSTNALSLAEPVPWRLVVAEQQDAGRGRYSRRWVSPVGTSVAMTMTVPLPADPDRWGWVPLLTGLAVRDALQGLGALDVALKWPNDVLVRAAGAPDRELGKVCGILCESTGDLVAVGVGLNVTVPQEDLPVPTATSLHLEGFSAPDARERVIVAVAREFAVRVDGSGDGPGGLDRIRAAYRAACSTIGREVRIHAPGNRVIDGHAVDVDEEGRLVVETPGGREVFAAGDVVHVRPGERSDSAS